MTNVNDHDESPLATWTHGSARVNGIRLHYVEAGEGPLVLLIHGFPEFWYSWRYQIEALSSAGFHVIAPDMRGYNESDKPRGVRSYRIEELSNDVLGLIHHAGEDRATIVGHDWGGAVVWSVAMRYPEAVARLIVLNSPHPIALQRGLRRPSQLRKSWYVFFYQLPWLPELAFRFRNYAWLDQTLRGDPVRSGAFDERDILMYKGAIAKPGALTAGINSYRAALRRNPFKRDQGVSQIQAPTLLIWGERDRFLDIRLTEDLPKWVPNIRVERIADASHWVQVDAYPRVNDLIVEFLRAAPNYATVGGLAHDR